MAGPFGRDRSTSKNMALSFIEVGDVSTRSNSDDFPFC